jgi:Tol biopolymer transport system component
MHSTEYSIPRNYSINHNNKGGLMRFFISLIGILFFIVSCGPKHLLITKTEAFRNLQQITDSDWDEYHPSVSSDGKNMVFASDKTGNGDIYLKTPPWGKSITQLTFHSAPDRYPSISKDGKRCAFASLRNGNWDIFYVNIGKGFAKTQVTSSVADEIAPSISPDGSKIAYIQKSKWDNKWYIWIADLDKGTFTQLGVGMYPSWSPDSRKIAYQKSSEVGQRWFNIWIFDLEDQMETEVLSGNERWGAINPHFSANGEMIVFSSSKMECFGTKVETEPGSSCSGCSGCLLSWSSSAINIVEPLELKKLAGSDIYAIQINGTGLTQITSHEANDWFPFWCGDGKIYFISNRTNNMDIWSIKGPE